MCILTTASTLCSDHCVQNYIVLCSVCTEVFWLVCSVFECRLLLSMRAHRTRRSVDRQDRPIHQGPTPTRHNALMISRRFFRKPFSRSIAHFARGEYSRVFTFLYVIWHRFWICLQFCFELVHLWYQGCYFLKKIWVGGGPCSLPLIVTVHILRNGGPDIRR